MIPFAVSFWTATTLYAILVGSQITEQYQWQKIAIWPEANNSCRSSRGTILIPGCAYAVAIQNNYNIPGFDVTFNDVVLTISDQNYLFVDFNWTRGNWTLYVGSQVDYCNR